VTKTPTPTPTVYVVPDTIYGVQTFGRDVAPEVWNPMAAAGVKYTRIQVLWNWIEPANTSPPTYQWAGYDAALGDLARVGFSVIGEIYGHPSWAASTACGPIDKVPLSRYGDFVKALVERYDADGQGDAAGSPRVTHWELGNEPDFDLAHAGGEGDYGSCFGGRASDYGAYLRTGYLAAKSASADSTVLFGGVAYDRFHNKNNYSPSGPFDYDFVGDVLDWLHANHGSESAWPFYDWMSFHVYNDYRNAWDGTQPYDQEILGKLKHLRNNQLVHVGWYDLRSRAIALTEASLPSMPPDAYTDRSEDLQSVYPGQLLIRSMSAGLRSAVWFAVEDHNLGDCYDIYDWLGLGILRSLTVYNAAQACGGANPIPDYQVTDDHEPKPAHSAYGVAVRELDGATYQAQLTTAQTGSAQIEAYRFTRPDNVALIAAFTDNGERLGRRGYAPVERTMTFSAGILPGWTGQIAVTDHLGTVTHRSGSSINVTIKQTPIYVRPE
jgi:hypothetical protein